MFSIERIPDSEGSTIKLGVVDEGYTAPWPVMAEQANRVLNLTFNSNDVILAGYAKSGTHWVWEILSMLMKGRAEPTQSTKEMLMFSFGTQEGFDQIPSPRIFNSHAPYNGMPYVLRPNVCKAKIIYLLRNPKDVCVSFYHHLRCAKDFDYHGSWNGFYSLFIQGKLPGGSWFDHIVGWQEAIESTTDSPILPVFYEDLKQNCSYQIKRMSEFLGFNYNNDLFEEITEKCKLENMRANDQKLKEQYPLHTSEDGNNFIFRKGIVGDWKNWFTVSQNEEFDQITQKRLRGTNLKFLYSIDDKQNFQN
ncbi:sulfotransferase 1B1 isoform X2 [Patella vulgata]|nr:sulfotransferase 1B1 isoform X2 [Patella vulgata]XP_050411503.1 sulfotransferase 1B1 isoform X2 [Patella vulgata]XP_050411523.1 sulfotransferase 1B1 isoform X2 [Patella vulgata]XP_050411532.1 sulfotransferase 1B1 isoform X2 [Patella vulgata]XP_050411541.1 sulfotransferase 1B1 isoform X2 [Patella vulgata]